MAPQRRRRTPGRWAKHPVPQALIAFYIFRQHQSSRSERPYLIAEPVRHREKHGPDRVTVALYLLGALLLFGTCVAAVVILGSALLLM